MTGLFPKEIRGLKEDTDIILKKKKKNSNFILTFMKELHTEKRREWGSW